MCAESVSPAKDVPFVRTQAEAPRYPGAVSVAWAVKPVVAGSLQIDPAKLEEADAPDLWAVDRIEQWRWDLHTR